MGVLFLSEVIVKNIELDDIDIRVLKKVLEFDLSYHQRCCISEIIHKFELATVKDKIKVSAEIEKISETEADPRG